jgi:hypothetical protein
MVECEYQGYEPMKTILRLLVAVMIIAFASQTMGALPEVPSDETGAKLWKSKREATVASLQSKPINERIPSLAEILRQLKTLGYRECPEEEAIISQLENVILSTSGHAKYFQEKLESMRSEVLVNIDKSSDEIERMRLGGKITGPGDYDDFRRTVFPILSLLPSCETVSVLGHFLNDPESRDGRDLTGEVIKFSDYQHYPPNCAAAYIAIANLGIEKPPGGAKPDRNAYDYNLDEVDAWKNWWNQVKDGNRTYRFIGSPIEYGPDGPASVEIIQRAQRSMKRDEERAAGHKKSFSVGEPSSVIAQIHKPLSIIGIFAVCALVTGFVWFFLIGRRAA